MQFRHTTTSLTSGTLQKHTKHLSYPYDCRHRSSLSNRLRLGYVVTKSLLWWCFASHDNFLQQNSTGSHSFCSPSHCTSEGDKHFLHLLWDSCSYSICIFFIKISLLYSTLCVLVLVHICTLGFLFLPLKPFLISVMFAAVMWIFPLNLSQWDIPR